MKRANNLFMEDVISISLSACDAIDKELKKRNVSINKEQFDKIYLEIEKQIELISNGDYKSNL